MKNINPVNHTPMDETKTLYRLRMTVRILGICVLLQAAGLCAVCCHIWKLSVVLKLLTQRLDLLALRLDLVAELHDDIAQILSQILELLSALTL